MTKILPTGRNAYFKLAAFSKSYEVEFERIIICLENQTKKNQNIL